MDNEVLMMIKAKLLDVKEIVKLTVDQLDVEIVESLSMGKTIAPDFDDTDLTNIQASIDDAASQLQDLSAEIAGFLQ